MNIEQMLRDAGRELDWPESPDLATNWPLAPVRYVAPPRRRVIVPRSIALAWALLLLIAVSAAAIPSVRNPVLEWLGLRGVEIRQVPRPLPERPGGAQFLPGELTTLDEALRRISWTALVAPGFGKPAVSYDAAVNGGAITLAYDNGPLITEYQGRVATPYLFKFLGPNAKADRIAIGNERGVWIHGAPHQYAYRDRDGNIQVDTIHSAADTLLWNHRGVLVRIEGAFSQAEALRIARSLRAAR